MLEYDNIRETESTSADYLQMCFPEYRENREDDDMESKRIRLNDRELEYKKRLDSKNRL